MSRCPPYATATSPCCAVPATRAGSDAASPRGASVSTYGRTLSCCWMSRGPTSSARPQVGERERSPPHPTARDVKRNGVTRETVAEHRVIGLSRLRGQWWDTGLRDGLSRDAISLDVSRGGVRGGPLALADLRPGAARGTPAHPAAAQRPAVRAHRRTARAGRVAPGPRRRHRAAG